MNSTSFERNMQRWLGMPIFNRRKTNLQPSRAHSIDLGNGAELGPEDVLESHFQRMARTRRATTPSVTAASTLRTHTVPVQVGDNLVTAITVLAPGLVPLAKLAEDVACALPPVQPAPDFRLSLHQALEQTHRQHTAQRVLGTRPGSPAQSASWPLWARLLLSIIAVIGLISATAWLLSPRRHAHASS